MLIETWDGDGIGYVTHDVATTAVERWHYSRVMPTGKLIKYGVWERGRCVGVILYGRGANRHMAGMFNLDITEAAECVRIALTTHLTPVSQALAATVRALQRDQPGLRLLFSYADPRFGHHGGIYQAANWTYSGVTTPQHYLRVHGRLTHPRSIHSRYGPGSQHIAWLRENVDPKAEWVDMPDKHRYLYPMDRAMRRVIKRVSLPYPSHAEEVSTVKQRPSGSQGQVRSLHSAP